MMHRTLSLTFLSLLLGSGPVFAQAPRSGGGGGGEQQKIMQQYQQLAAEKTALQTQLAQAKKDLDAAKTDLAAVTKERDALKAHARTNTGVPAAQVAQLTASKAAAERNLEQFKQRTNELIGRYRDMAGNLKEVEADRNTLRTTLAQRDAAYDKCASDNLQLFELTNEALDRYQHVGLFTRVSATEPFTQITRTRIDNLVVEYRERALQLREKKAATGTGPVTPPTPPATPPTPNPGSTR
jgi:chromosome segregation ATPase